MYISFTVLRLGVPDRYSVDTEVMCLQLFWDAQNPLVCRVCNSTCWLGFHI